MLLWNDRYSAHQSKFLLIRPIYKVDVGGGYSLLFEQFYVDIEVSEQYQTGVAKQDPGSASNYLMYKPQKD